jgi:hypothetical protein
MVVRQHVVAHTDPMMISSGIYTGVTESQTCHLFFNITLPAEVETTYPENTNIQEISSNEDDMRAPA